jgi:hypothetical protein
MRTYIYAFLLLLLGLPVLAAAPGTKAPGATNTDATNTGAMMSDTKCYELRIYSCFPGRRDALVRRFKDHTRRIFDKYNMQSIGYWLPSDSSRNTLYYILAYPSREARDSSWKAFHDDPEWIEVSRRSEETGKIVEKVTSVFMNLADISPVIRPSRASTDRSFELRTYYCPPGKLPNLLTRFRDHTIKLFRQHGMESIGYWTTVEPDGSQPRLVYILAHPSEAAAATAWTAFRSDPVWIKAKAESEKDGPIVDRTESVFLNPLPFSTIR